MKKNWVLMALVISLLMLALAGCGNESNAQVAEKSISVATTAAAIQDITSSKAYSGVARGESEVQIYPKLSARVQSIAVTPGDVVEAGQTLMVLDNSDYLPAAAQARAALDAASAGSKANALSLETAQKNYQRMVELHAAGAISDVELENSKMQLDALQTGASEAGVAQAQAILQSANDTLANCNITTPIAGVVGSVSYSVGDMASPAMAAAVVTSTGNMEIAISVAESDIRYVYPGAAVTVKLRSLDNLELAGTVKSVAQSSGSTSLSFDVKIIFENPDSLVKSGMFAEVDMATESRSGVLAVPVNAVVQQTGSSVVYVVDEENRARAVEVTTGLKDQEYIEILSGLKTGQQVITQGNTLVSNGTLVKVTGAEGN
ncbi:MAG: efflux RND transporter periplasmic adaptor subunit [Syntrophomonadaceae bacterium]|nr:efflux RND transporter periplasmic adaptor subunit [Syntrophomonadaceae bacterium]